MKKKPTKKKVIKKVANNKVVKKKPIVKTKSLSNYSYIDVIRKDKYGKSEEVRCMNTDYSIYVVIEYIKKLKLGDVLSIVPVEILKTK